MKKRERTHKEINPATLDTSGAFIFHDDDGIFDSIKHEKTSKKLLSLMLCTALFAFFSAGISPKLVGFTLLALNHEVIHEFFKQ